MLCCVLWVLSLSRRPYCASVPHSVVVVALPNLFWPLLGGVLSPLPHSMIDTETSQVCVVMKGDDPTLVQSVKKALTDLDVTVLTVKEAQDNYSTYELKRQLCASFDRFIPERK